MKRNSLLAWTKDDIVTALLAWYVKIRVGKCLFQSRMSRVVDLICIGCNIYLTNTKE